MNAGGLLFSAEQCLGLFLAHLLVLTSSRKKFRSIWRQIVPKPLPTSLLAMPFSPCAFTGYKTLQQLPVET